MWKTTCLIGKQRIGNLLRSQKKTVKPLLTPQRGFPWYLVSWTSHWCPFPDLYGCIAYNRLHILHKNDQKHRGGGFLNFDEFWGYHGVPLIHPFLDGIFPPKNTIRWFQPRCPVGSVGSVVPTFIGSGNCKRMSTSLICGDPRWESTDLEIVVPLKALKIGLIDAAWWFFSHPEKDESIGMIDYSQYEWENMGK